MTKSRGLRTEPWGTPQEDVCQEDRSVSHLTRKQRDDRYDLNQLRTEPWIPNQDEICGAIKHLLSLLTYLLTIHSTTRKPKIITLNVYYFTSKLVT